MSTATLDDFLALNEQLIALHEAGVALDPALGLGGNNVASHLARINAQVALRVRRGDSLIAALQAEDAALPPAYRALMQAGLQTGDWEATLSGHRRLSQSLERSRHVVLVGLIYPTVVCGLAFAGFLAFYRYVVPTLDELYGSLGLALTVAEWLRATLPLWSAAPLIALA
ncbi:MAG TPA: type II secretion system F family protein, partial [Pirellulaceae bacterium]|nr:type II secretion system F family protein [Pirellulaceae bacterium]